MQSLYMTSNNTYISPKVIAERVERYFNVKVSTTECIITSTNHHYIMYFNDPLSTLYMEMLQSKKCAFLQTLDGILYIRADKPTNLDDYITKYYCNMVTGEMYYKHAENNLVFKHNGERYVLTTEETPFL